MSSTQKPGDEHRSLPDDIALAAGMPRGHQVESPTHQGSSHEGSLRDVPSPGTYTASTHTSGTQTHSIRNPDDSIGDLRDRAAEAAHDARDRVSDRVQDLRERASGSVQDLRERASDAYDDARDWASDATENGRRRIGDLGERGSARLQDGRSAVEDFVTENPLLVGVVGLAAGLLIGALLPRTRTEDQNVGPWADEVRDQGLRLARDVTHRGREFVATALDPENLNAAVQRATGADTSEPNQTGQAQPGQAQTAGTASRPH